MKFKRIVDLSYELDPEHETRVLSVRPIPTAEYKDMFPRYIVSEDDKNYHMSEIRMVSHIGTHIETPYHCKKQGNDLSQIPLNQLIGEAFILNLKVEKKEEISLEKVKASGEGIKKGDIVFCRTNYGRGDIASDEKERLFDAPYFSLKAVEWLIEKGMKLFGTETEMENLLGGTYVNHHALFSRGIPLVENLANLDQIQKERVTVLILPPKIKNLESFPVRVIAIE